MNQKLSEPDESMRRHLYEEQCLKYQDGEHAAIQELDKAILTLSAGLLGLSLALIKDVVPLSQAVWLPVLFGSWSLLGLAIASTLISFIFSKLAFKQMQTNAYDYYIKKEESALDKGWQSAATRYLTYAEAACFGIAMILTLVFVITNVQHAHVTIRAGEGNRIGQMNKLSWPNGPAREQRGVEPASMIRVPESKPQPSSSSQSPQPQGGTPVSQQTSPSEAQGKPK